MKEDASVLCKYLLTRQPPTTFMVKNRKSMQSDAQPQSIEEQNESDQGKSKYSPMRWVFTRTQAGIYHIEQAVSTYILLLC